ncbi:hypothetical protein [Bacteroides reticulotermitis]|uniref:hypothetical protein n=1 Tax=Bacteroides reticulotermitis TaxID=1133319 RepID=UPI00130E89F4|nr:hypothetical protein [Bacteroides reticulotermitis]
MSATIKSPTPVTFEIGDHFTYRNEVFTLNYDPSVIKKATVNSVGDSFTYESVKFNSFSDELARCEFLDYILNDNGLHFSSLPTFSFYAGNIQDLADRIQANLNRIYTSGKAWTVIVHPEYVNIKNINISVSKITVWGALELVKSQFNANFTIKGRTIVIGTAGAVIDNVFQYGKGNGLVKIQRVTQSDQQIITRLRVYGSQRNLPPLYYATMVNPIINAPVLNAEYGWDGTGNRYSVNIAFDFVMKFKGTTAIPVTIGGKSYSMLPHPNFQGIGLMYFSSSQEMRDAVYNGVVIVITSGIETDNVPLKYKTPSGSLVPNNMAVQNLMLPSFPIDTIDPYLDSANIGELGIMEGSIFFDGSDSAKDEIFPSMEGITAQQLIDAGIPVSVDPGDNGNLDEISGGSTNIDGTAITDNGVYLDGETVPSFKITLKDIGFNLWDYRTSESPMISMKDGMCGGREFEVKSCEKSGNKYVLTCTRIYDDSTMLYYPYSDFKILADDKFVLLNINMPDVYIKAASQRLLKAGQDYLKLNDYVRYTYQMNISQVYMARRPDLYASLVEGDLMLFTDNDLMIDGSITINTLRIVEGEDIKPSFEVTLTEDKQVGTLQKIQNQIDSIANGTQSGSGYNMQQISQMIRTVGSRIFLRRDIEDFTNYILTFFKGLKIGNFMSGMLVGRGAAITIDSNNKTEFEVDRIKVREELIVPKITFNCIDTVTGEFAGTFAFGTVKAVDIVNKTIELDLLDGQAGTLKAGDICRGIFHFLEGGNVDSDSYDTNGFLNYSGFATSYFTPSEILVNQPGVMKFRYTLQSGTTVHPTKGMNFYAYGNFNDKSRQSLLYINREYIRFLSGVNTWVINPDKHIPMQIGNTEGLNIGGVDMSDYSGFMRNLYIMGSIIQFTPSQKEELKGQDAYSVILSTYEQAIVVDDDNNIIGGTVEEVTVISGDKTVVTGEATVVTSINKLTSRIQAFKGKTELFYSPTYEEGAYMVTLNPIGCVAVIENGIVKITEIIDVDNISVGITVNCEGNAIFEKAFKVTAVRNGQSPIVVDFTNG